MINFKLICPECSAEIITSRPEAMLWEHCPHCGHHVWETYDLMMAEVETEKRIDERVNPGMRFHSI